MLVLSPAWLGGLIQMPVCEGAGLRTQVATRSPSISRWWTTCKMPKGDPGDRWVGVAPAERPLTPRRARERDRLVSAWRRTARPGGGSRAAATRARGSHGVLASRVTRVAATIAAEALR